MNKLPLSAEHLKESRSSKFSRREMLCLCHLIFIPWLWPCWLRSDGSMPGAGGQQWEITLLQVSLKQTLEGGELANGFGTGWNPRGAQPCSSWITGHYTVTRGFGRYRRLDLFFSKSPNTWVMWCYHVIWSPFYFRDSKPSLSFLKFITVFEVFGVVQVLFVCLFVCFKLPAGILQTPATRWKYLQDNV